MQVKKSDRKEGFAMEFNLVVFFIGIALVIIAAAVATVAAVSGAMGAISYKDIIDEEE